MPLPRPPRQRPPVGRHDANAGGPNSFILVRTTAARGAVVARTLAAVGYMTMPTRQPAGGVPPDRRPSMRYTKGGARDLAATARTVKLPQTHGGRLGVHVRAKQLRFEVRMTNGEAIMGGTRMIGLDLQEKIPVGGTWRWIHLATTTNAIASAATLAVAALSAVGPRTVVPNGLPMPRPSLPPSPLVA